MLASLSLRIFLAVLAALHTVRALAQETNPAEIRQLTVGQKGQVRGLGLHPAPPADQPTKSDGKAPAGRVLDPTAAVPLRAAAAPTAADLATIAVPRAVAPPPLTAAADPAGWTAAVVIPALGPPRNHAPAEGVTLPPTTIRLLWDADALYVRFDCVDSKVYTPFAGHDEPLYKGDVCEVFLDAVGDALQWFEIQVAANNATFDQNLVLTTAPRSDAQGKLLKEVLDRNWWMWPSFEIEGLRSAAGPTPTGWTVELAIPARATAHRLGTGHFAADQLLRANFLRYDWSEPQSDGTRKLTALNWAPVAEGCPHISPQAMGYLLLRP